MQSNNRQHCGDTNFFHLGVGVGEGGIGEKKRERESVKEVRKIDMRGRKKGELEKEMKRESESCSQSQAFYRRSE